MQADLAPVVLQLLDKVLVILTFLLLQAVLHLFELLSGNAFEIKFPQKILDPLAELIGRFHSRYDHEAEAFNTSPRHLKD